MSDPYATHIKVFEFIFQHIDKPKSGVEIGMGLYSTPLLINKCELLTSVEQQSAKWYLEVEKKFNNAQNWTRIFKIGFFEMDFMDTFDFAFVDGAGYFRAAQVVQFMQFDVKNIVLHDSNLAWYGFGTLDQPAKDMNYFDYAFEWEHPHTRVFTKDKKLIDAIKNL